MKPDNDKPVHNCTFNDAEWKRDFDAAFGLVFSVLFGLIVWAIIISFLCILFCR